MNSISKGLSLLTEEQKLRVEVLVANNASTDNTREICLNFKNWIYIEQPRNLGYDENIISLYINACGEWILFLSDDDVFEYSALPTLVNLLEKSQHLDVIFCSWYSLASDKSKVIHTHKALLQYKDEFNFKEVCKFTPFYFLSSFTLRRSPINKNNLLKGTYATQMEIALHNLNLNSRCMVFNELLVGRLEPTTELIGGNCDSSISWKIHIGFTNVRRKFQSKYGIELSPIAELSSALSSWNYVRDSSRPIIRRIGTLFISFLYGVGHTKILQLRLLPAYIYNRFQNRQK